MQELNMNAEKLSFESSLPVRVIQFESIQLILDRRLLKSKYFALGNTILKYFIQANLLSQATFVTLAVLSVLQIIGPINQRSVLWRYGWVDWAKYSIFLTRYFFRAY